MYACRILVFTNKGKNREKAHKKDKHILHLGCTQMHGYSLEIMTFHVSKANIHAFFKYMDKVNHLKINVRIGKFIECAEHISDILV